VKVAARWLARVDGVSGQIRVFSLAVTAFSTFSLVLQNSGRGELVTPLGVVLAVGLPAYIYVYAEGGVWNQVSRDKQDMSTNYAGPTMLMDDVQIAVGTFVAVHGRKPTEEEREEIESAIREQWSTYRNGVELE